MQHVLFLDANFEREIAAFEALRPELLGSYRGEAVAIYEGRVVAHGKDKMTVLDRLAILHCDLFSARRMAANGEVVAGMPADVTGAIAPGIMPQSTC